MWVLTYLKGSVMKYEEKKVLIKLFQVVLHSFIICNITYQLIALTDFFSRLDQLESIIYLKLPINYRN